MFSKFEIAVATFCVFIMALGIYISQVDSILFKAGKVNPAQVIDSQQNIFVVTSDAETAELEREQAFREAFDSNGNINRMVIDDIKIGTGDEVESGDVVSVHYIGTLQSGEEFDNSKKRGEPFEFQIGAGMVIKGWEEGLLGMKIGGQRVLVIPPDKAYGDQGVGPIPPNSTLVFAIELVDIK